MARVVGGIGTSHAPSIAHAYDHHKQQDPLWKPLFDGYAPLITGYGLIVLEPA